MTPGERDTGRAADFVCFFIYQESEETAIIF
jgi:hypothetical protein